MSMKKFLILLVLVFGLFSGLASAQNPSIIGTVPVQTTTAYYGLTVISSTATANTQTTLTIPAPTNSGQYNYICYLAFSSANDAAGGAATNQVTTSTNFNAFALKFSAVATTFSTYDWSQTYGTPGLGCVKSTSPTTATTFVSPAGIAGRHFTWYATYYQAP